MAGERENIRMVNRERLVPGQHEPHMPAELDVFTRQVPRVPLNEEPPDLLETCLDNFGQSPWIRYSTYTLIFALLVLLIGFYLMFNQGFFVGIAVLLLAIVIFGVALYVLAVRGAQHPGAVIPTDRPYLLAETPTLMVGVPRRGQVAAIDVGNPPSPSSAHLPDPDVPGPSGLQPPVLPISDEHFSRTLRSGKKTPGVISPRSERQRVFRSPDGGESSGRRRVSEGASSPSQIGSKSISRRKKITTRRASIHEQSTSND